MIADAPLLNASSHNQRQRDAKAETTTGTAQHRHICERRENNLNANRA